MRMLFLLTALAATTSAFGEEARIDVPIMIAGEIGKDGCPVHGRVSALTDQTDGAVSVRSGPGENEPFREIDRLQKAEPVLVCENLGGWSGIVYGTNPLGCRTYAVLPMNQEYTGPCHRGWVQSRFIETGTK